MEDQTAQKMGSVTPESLYAYEVVVREMKMRKVVINSSRELNRDQLKTMAMRGDGEENFSVLEHLEVLNIDKKMNSSAL